MSFSAPVSFRSGQDYLGWKPSDQQNVVLLAIAGLRSKSLHSCKGFSYPLDIFYNFSIEFYFLFYNIALYNSFLIFFIILYIFVLFNLWDLHLE